MFLKYINPLVLIHSAGTEKLFCLKFQNCVDLFL